MPSNDWRVVVLIRWESDCRAGSGMVQRRSRCLLQRLTLEKCCNAEQAEREDRAKRIRTLHSYCLAIFCTDPEQVREKKSTFSFVNRF